jgi:hypothetical protein
VPQPHLYPHLFGATALNNNTHTHTTAELEALSKAASSVRASLPSGALVDADTAVAAGRGAGWLLQSLLGVGAMQAAKAGADTAMANVGAPGCAYVPAGFPAWHMHIHTHTHTHTLLSTSWEQQVGVVAVPSAVVSMVGVTALLMLMGQKNADSLVAVHDSVIAPWTHDLLGLWFVPAVAIVPVLLKGMQGAWVCVCVCEQAGGPGGSALECMASIAGALLHAALAVRHASGSCARADARCVCVCVCVCTLLRCCCVSRARVFFHTRSCRPARPAGRVCRLHSAHAAHHSQGGIDAPGRRQHAGRGSWRRP